MRYLILRACERLALRPAEFDRLPRDRQIELLGYEDLREAEEATTFGCPLLGGGKD